jgi:hypothetical protein
VHLVAVGRRFGAPSSRDAATRLRFRLLDYLHIEIASPVCRWDIIESSQMMNGEARSAVSASIHSDKYLCEQDSPRLRI